MAKLIKVDRNGSKHFEGYQKCDKCGGDGVYKWGAMEWLGNGQVRPQYAGTCFKCNGAGQVYTKWIERTPEYQAKLDAKREAKWAKIEAEREARRAEAEARKAEEEARRAAQKAISKHVGTVGQKLAFAATYLHRGSYTVRSFKGYGTETMYAHTFADADGNKFVWKTTNYLCGIEEDTSVQVAGTVKEHSEYNGEKQTTLTRCKITA